MSDGGGPSLAIRLHRDALTTPWGFRLQGGKDFKAPLRVQRVFVGSPAESELQRGDVIVAIDNYDVSPLTHKEAEDIIKKAGGSIMLRVRRATGFTHTPSSPSPSFARQTPKSPSSQMNFGTDYTQYPGRQQAQPRAGQVSSGGQDGGMLNRLNSSLTQALYEGGGNHDNGAADDYESKSVGQLRQQFATLSPTGQGRSQQASNGQRKRWSRPQGPTFSAAPNHLTDIGWTPFSSNKVQSQRYSRQPQRTSSPPINSPARAQPPRPATAHEFDKPAWAGTLRSSGGPRHWEMSQAESIAPASVPRQYREAHSEPPAMPQVHRANPGGAAPVQPHQPKIQVMRYGPTGQQVYEQHEAPHYGDSDSARVVHLQYNTPLGLYSRENVEQALEGQTHDKAGYGTMEVSGGSPGKQFNPSNSAVLRLLAEEEAQKAGPGGRGRRAVPSNTSAGGELKQSPMIYALDATYGNGGGASEHAAAGMSDF